MITLILAAAVLAALFYHYFIKPTHYWKHLGVKQANPVWIFGENWGIVSKTESLADMVMRCYNRFPNTRYYGLYQGLDPTLMIKDLHLLKQINIRDFDHFTDHKDILPEETDPVWGITLFALKGKKWREMRAILSPSYTSSKMRAMFSLMSDCSRNFINHYQNKDKDFFEIELKDTFTRIANDVIASTAFGIDVDSFKQPNNKFYMMGKEGSDFTGIWKTILFFGHFLFPRIYKYLNIPFSSDGANNFFRDLVDETIKTREKNNIIRPDMIYLMMEAKKGGQNNVEESGIDTGFATVEDADIDKATTRKVTDKDITAQALTFFLSGFETVSTLMCFMCYELTVNPDIQARLRKEIEETIADYKQKITYEALLKMKYMDMVVSESLRKWPSIVLTDRICTMPYVIEPVNANEKPVYLQKNTSMMIPIIGIHRDPKYYPSPDRFDPERFSEENKGKINPLAYMPFGFGPRSCIGSRFALIEVKIILCHLLTNFELVPVERTSIPLKISAKTFTLAAEGGFWTGLKRL